MSQKRNYSLLDLTIAGILFIVFFVAIVYFVNYAIAQYGVLDSTSISAIGSIIGGITAPFASLLASALVFLALKAQIDANNRITKQIQEQTQKEQKRLRAQYIDQQFQFILKEIDDFSYEEQFYDMNEYQTASYGFDHYTKQILPVHFKREKSDPEAFEKNYKADLNINRYSSLLVLIAQTIELVDDQLDLIDLKINLSRIKYIHLSRIRQNLKENHQPNEDGFKYFAPRSINEMLNTINLEIEKIEVLVNEKS